MYVNLHLDNDSYFPKPDPFVKLQLIMDQKVVKTKKTSTKKNTIDPVFNETFSLHVSPSALDEVCLLVSVWDYNSKSRDNFIGQILLGKYPSGKHPADSEQG